MSETGKMAGAVSALCILGFILAVLVFGSGCPPETTTRLTAPSPTVATAAPGTVSTDSLGWGWFSLRDGARKVTCYAHNGTGLVCLSDGETTPEMAP